MHENEQDYLMIDVKNILRSILQHIVPLVLFTVSCALLGYIWSAFLIKPTYSANAQLLVNNRGADQQSAVISQADLTASTSLVNTYSIILKSHDVLEKVIADCGLNESIDSLSKKVSVSSVNSTQVMKITIQSHDPQEALDICTDLVKEAPQAIVDAIGAGSVTTVSSPYTTGKPIAPSKKRFTVFAGGFGFLAYLAYIIIREITNDKFKSTEDIRNVLDLNILGVIPVESHGKTGKKRRVSLPKRQAKS